MIVFRFFVNLKPMSFWNSGDNRSRLDAIEKEEELVCMEPGVPFQLIDEEQRNISCIRFIPNTVKSNAKSFLKYSSKVV